MPSGAIWSHTYGNTHSDYTGVAKRGPHLDLEGSWRKQRHTHRVWSQESAPEMEENLATVKNWLVAFLFTSISGFESSLFVHCLTDNPLIVTEITNMVLYLLLLRNEQKPQSFGIPLCHLYKVHIECTIPCASASLVIS